MRGLLRTDITEEFCAQYLETLHRQCIAKEIKILYSLVPGQNGGADPFLTLPSKIRSGTIPPTATSDCVGTYFRGRGLDRYQPVRFAHIYGGWINCDSMLFDAIGEKPVTGRGTTEGPRKMFRVASYPRRGVAVVVPARYVLGKKAPGSYGHIMGVVGYDNSVKNWSAEKGQFIPAWDSMDIECWKRLQVVHCHGGFYGRTVNAISRESVFSALGKGNRWKTARLVELI